MSEKRFTILLHDHFEGCIEIANPEGLISSQGAKPRGMEISPKGLKKLIAIGNIKLTTILSIASLHTSQRGF